MKQRRFHHLSIIGLSLLFLLSHAGISSLVISSKQTQKHNDTCQESCCCAPGNCNCDHHRSKSGTTLVFESPDCSPIKKSASLSSHIKEIPIPIVVAAISPVIKESSEISEQIQLQITISSQALFRPPMS